MEGVALVLMLFGRTLSLPMADWATCQEAIIQARNELNPAHVYCTTSPALSTPTGACDEACKKRLQQLDLEFPVTDKRSVVVLELVGPTLHVRMPSMATCSQVMEAVLQLRKELNAPATAACRYNPQVLLALIWSQSGEPLDLPMADWAACQEAIVQARNELNPVRAYCSVYEPVARIDYSALRDEAMKQALTPQGALLVISMTRRSGYFEVPMRDLGTCRIAMLQTKNETQP
jgi:hypothetical protein